MQEFTPGTAYAQLYRRRYVVALIGLFAGVMAILLLFNNTSGDTDNALYGVVTMGVIFAVLVRRVLGRPARLVEGQRLIVSGSELTLKRRTIEPITLRADDIRDIRKTGKRENGGTSFLANRRMCIFTCRPLRKTRPPWKRPLACYGLSAPERDRHGY